MQNPIQDEPKHFFEAHAEREQRRAVPAHLEYPKYIRENGKEAHVLDAEGEARVRAEWGSAGKVEPVKEPEPTVFDVGDEAETETMPNMLKRGPGRPPKPREPEII
jgi:hypothetical protein